jgi:two-component system chemotaxis response regulator CheY
MEKKILIVDDSPTLRSSLSFCLSNAGYVVTEAVDGKDGLQQLEKLKEKGEVVSLIISDINMPRMDGVTFIKEIKKTSFKYVPILVLTTESQESKKQEGKDAGAAGWLTKPFRSEDLLWIIKKFTRRLHGPKTTI